MSSVNDTIMRESAIDDTVLQKRPSNPQQRFSQRPSNNIFAGKERKSNQQASQQLVDKENGPRKSKRRNDLDEAQKILNKKMQQMDGRKPRVSATYGK